MNKQESKYFYTASLMDEALLLLLEKKDYEFITVKELCEKAGVNRSTFYLHYESMDDLLEETTERLNEKFLSSFSALPDKNDATSSVLTKSKYLIPYLEFIRKNLKVYKLIHEKPQLFQNDKAFQAMYERIFDVALTHFGVPEKDKKYVLAFYTQGAKGIVNEWIKRDCADEIERVASLIEKNTFADSIENERKE